MTAHNKKQKMSFQDWEPKVLVKSHYSVTDKKQAVLSASRRGETISVKKNSGNPDYLHLKKVENEEETFKHATVSLSLSKQIAQARNNAKMTQRDLDQRLNLPPNTIKQYEQGTIIPNKVVINNIKKVLGDYWK
jgi:ribosome-binding protein aMBF1 (putative translation factor)